MRNFFICAMSLFSLATACYGKENQVTHLLSTYTSDSNSRTNLSLAQEASPSVCPKYFSYRPAINETAFFTGVQYLYWKLDEPGMNFATKRDFPTAMDNGTPTNSLLGDFKQVDFQYDSGVRAWVGYRLPQVFWEVEANYTFYYTDKEQQVSVLQGGDIDGTFPEFTRSAVVQASSAFDFHYHQARLQLARSFFVADSILLRPFIGMQGAWVDQDWHAVYKGEDGSQTVQQNDWSYQAGGIHLGLNTEWYLAYGLSLFFNGSASSLYGSHHLFSSMDPSIFSGGPFQRISPKDHRVAQSIQMAAGIEWGMLFKSIAIKANIGYELNSWFNIHEVYRVNLAGIDSTSPLDEKIPILTTGALNLQGLVAGISIEF